MDMDTLKAECLACTRCELCATRTNVVFGQGVPDAEVEAPAVLPPAQLLALHERAGASALRDGLGAALAPAALAGAVIDALAAQLSAAFDRAALAIARGEPAEPQRQAMRWLLSQLVQGAGAAPRA